MAAVAAESKRKGGVYLNDLRVASARDQMRQVAASPDALFRDAETAVTLQVASNRVTGFGVDE